MDGKQKGPVRGSNTDFMLSSFALHSRHEAVSKPILPRFGQLPRPDASRLEKALPS